jgi:tetratricopeptide (TPR) repeat protein
MSRFFNRLTTKNFALGACLILAAVQLAGCGSRAERAQSYYDKAKSYLAKQDFVKARIEIRNALQLNADMVEAWRSLAQIDEHDQNFRELAGSLRRIVELDPKDVASNLALGKMYLLSGDLDHALKTADAANKIDPKNPNALALKAAVLYRLKDIDGTLQTAQSALEIDPGNTDANVVIAVVKYSQRDPSAALQFLDHVNPASKDDLGVLYLKINIFDHTGKVQQAEALLRRLIELHPKEPVFRAQLIQFFLEHKRQDDAVNELRATVVANPADVNSEMNLVNLLRITKGPDAARAELLARINAGGQVFPYQIALAKFDFVQGNVDDSTKELKKVIDSSKSSDEALTARATLADMYVSKNNVAAAEPLVTEILKLDNHNIDGLRLRAAIRIDRGQFDDAIADLRTALNDKPQSPELLASLGLAYERSGSIELADKAYFDATKASAFAPAFGLNYVSFLRRRGLTERAENVLVDLAGRNQNNVAVLSALAQVKLARQDWIGAHAIADAVRRLGDKGDTTIADQINGAAFVGQGKFTDSLAVLQNAYDANPGAVQPMAALVGVYLQAHQIDKAEAFVKAALNANPKNAEALVLMGSIQLVKNDQDQAAKNFSEAIKQRPKDVVGYKALAELYARQRKMDDALNTIRAGLQQDPKSFALRLTLAGLLEAKGDFEAAISEYDGLLKDQPGSMVVANNLASLLADHRTDKASMERANSLAVLLKNSQIPQFKDTLGWVNYRQGDYAAASSLLESAATQLPNIALVHYHLGMVYLAAGQDGKASEQFSKVHDLAPNDADLKEKIDTALKSRPAKPKGANG